MTSPRWSPLGRRQYRPPDPRSRLRPRPQRQRSAGGVETGTDNPAIAPTEALNSGPGLAMDAAQPTAADQGQRNRHTRAPRRPQSRCPKQHLSLTFAIGRTARRATGYTSPPMQALQRRFSSTRSIRRRLGRIARSNIERRRINALRYGESRRLLLEERRQRVNKVVDVTPYVRAKRATTAGRQARAGENVPRTARPGQVACRCRSA